MPPTPSNWEFIPENTLPLTEAAGWVFTQRGLPYVSYISNPVYLLTVDDDFDKIDLSAVLQANRHVFQLSKSYAENL
ncbi:MAG: hypothetical protein AAF694_28655 [Bacteroidota bacterium]